MAKHSGGCIAGVVTVILVVVVISVTYFCWPKAEDNDDNDNNDNIDGNNNKIDTTEIKTTEVSMIHIEGLQGQLSTSRWLMFIGFSSIFLMTIYAAIHFKCVKLPRRMKKKLEMEKVVSRLDDVEAALIERGYMTKRNKKKGKKKVTKKRKMSKAIKKEKEAFEEGSESEEE